MYWPIERSDTSTERTDVIGSMNPAAGSRGWVSDRLADIQFTVGTGLPMTVHITSMTVLFEPSKTLIEVGVTLGGRTTGKNGRGEQGG